MTRRRTRRILDFVSLLLHALTWEQALSRIRRKARLVPLTETGAIIMDLGTQIMWVILYTFTSCTIFYTLGHSQGKKDGYWKGRSVGMRIGSEREANRG
jgi:hypothetical protein